MFWFWTYFPHVRHKCVYYLTTKTKITDSSFFSPSSPLRPDRISVMFSFQPWRSARPVRVTVHVQDPVAIRKDAMFSQLF